MDGSAFHGMMLGGLGSIFGGMNAPFGNFGGPHPPTTPGQYQEAFGLGSEGDASYVLNDPSLTVEDKVTLMIMRIMKKMDEDIERQAQYINKIQQQQQGQKKGGKGGGSSPSIDVETMKLKRMI